MADGRGRARVQVSVIFRKYVHVMKDDAIEVETQLVSLQKPGVHNSTLVEQRCPRLNRRTNKVMVLWEVYVISTRI